VANEADEATLTHGTVIVVRTTYPDRATAGDRGERLVAARLAACAQVAGPLVSTYIWEGAMERTEEWCCTLKTSLSALPACLSAIRASHPYAVPELIWDAVRATPDYAAWVEKVTAPAAAGDHGGRQP